MRVIYNTCFANPWLDVAQKMRQEHGWEPVYWNGYHDDNSRRLVPEAFPGCIYHPYHAGWKGIFPEPFNESTIHPGLNLDFLSSIAVEELLALRMMDRMDMDRHSFSPMERQQHFRNLLRRWEMVIDKLQPDVVVSAIVPHRVFDYALYLLCRFKKIPYLTFRETAFRGRLVPVTDVASIGDILNEDWHKWKSSATATEALREQLPPEMRDRYERVLQDYNAAIPDYMQSHVVNHAKSTGVVSLTKKMIEDVREGTEIYFGQEGFVKKGMSYLVERDKSPKKSKLSIARYAKMKLDANRYKKALKSLYNDLARKPDWEESFVIFNLHYQPEMTSNPSGGIFADQQLAIETLSRHLPEDWKVYVKEHPAQFYAHQEGHTARSKGFYEDLAAMNKVKLLPLSTDPFEAIRRAKAVCTITGTTGWEGMVLGKPIIIFGLSWYEKYEGVLRITNEESAQKTKAFIENFKFDERSLLSYLIALSENSVWAYTQRGHIDKLDVTREESVQSLSERLLQMYHDATAAD